MLLHVVPKVVKQLHLLLHRSGELIHCVVMLDVIKLDTKLPHKITYLTTFIVNVVNVETIGKQQQFGQVVEDDANTIVVKAVSIAVLVTVVNPLADPDNWLRLRIFSLVLHARVPGTRFCGNELSQLLVQL